MIEMKITTTTFIAITESLRAQLAYAGGTLIYAADADQRRDAMKTIDDVSIALDNIGKSHREVSQ